MGRSRRPSSTRLRQFAVYVAVGGVGTVVYLALYNSLRLTIGPLSANAISTAVALGMSFWGNRRLAFGVVGQPGILRDFVLFTAVFIGTLALSSAALAGLFTIFDDPGIGAENAALLGATAVTFVLRYVLLSSWVFPR